jgi:ribosomal-protein-alanine N-acetyltransferase
MIALTPVSLDDCEDLLHFEQENRAFFESQVTARPAGYHSPAGIQAAVERALREAQEDLGYQYLIRDAQSQLIGRINLSHVRRTHFFSAELGYRIAQRACGQGHASAAVRQMLDLAFGPWACSGWKPTRAPPTPPRCGCCSVAASCSSDTPAAAWSCRASGMTGSISSGTGIRLRLLIQNQPA